MINYITPSINESSLMNEFKKYLKDLKTSNGKVNFSMDLNKPPKNTRKPVIQFTDIAYTKMWKLVTGFSTEVGWHGIVKKLDNYTFLVEDIMVYPQVVTGATVQTDQEEYSNWLMGQPDDVFNNIRFHGHSHVNMHTSPSGTDTTMYNSFLQSLPKDDYYIFFIMNKSGSLYKLVYDYKRNLMFEGVDVIVQSPINDWFDSAQELVKTHTVSTGYSARTAILNRQQELELEREAYGYGYDYDDIPLAGTKVGKAWWEKELEKEKKGKKGGRR